MDAVVVHSCENSFVEMVYEYCKPDESKVVIKREKKRKQFKEPHVSLPNGFVAEGLLTTIKAIARFSGSNLLGQSALEEAEVDQWAEYCLTQITACCHERTEMNPILKSLNTYLADRVFFVGQSVTVADFFLFLTLYQVYCTLSFQEKEKVIHVSRWFQEMQKCCSVVDKCQEKVLFLRNMLY